MTTQFIGIKEFRQNISALQKKALKEELRYVVMNKNVPVLEVRPLDEKSVVLEHLLHEIAEAREDVKRGRVVSQEKLFKKLGL
jgi:PHD/YefM family antitoxin component YafN of YafNO toxin-antitoxin module